MNPFIEQFLIEGRELVEQAVADLLALETHPGEATHLDGVFRAVHTLKGSAGIVDFAAMARGLHAAEDTLSAVRARIRSLTPDLIGDCLSALDQVVRWLDAIEASGGELPDDADPDADAMVARFDRAPAASASIPRPVADRGAVDQVTPDLTALCREILKAQQLMLDASEPRGFPGHLASAGRVVANVLRHIGRPVATGEALAGVEAAGDPAPLIATIRTILAGTWTTPGSDVGPDLMDSTGPAQEVGARALRVDVERIDTLVRLAGELTTVKSAIGLLCGLAESGADPAELAARLKAQHGQLDRLATDLRHAVLRIRVLPLREVFQRFPRVVRDLGSNLGKPIQLLTEGDDTEADKEIVENLFEPLLHVLRNAADHGLEDADARVSAGKPVPGTIRLRAARVGEQVIVEIEDDGRGIDVSRIRALAEERGVASAGVLAAMNDAEIVDLIFTPGFSTAARVTTVSGRGVGMDAVRTAVGRLGGSVGVESRMGQGTTVRFVLPFTLLITRIITVQAGGQMFGIPLDCVIETVQIGKGQIMPVGAAHAFALRKQIVPLFDLAAVAGIERGRPSAAETVVVVIAMGGDLVGLAVDRLGERIDAMLKPMDGLLSGTAGIAGTTLLGDGRVLIVLDVEELLR
ncbi:chemotaxis protein CheA [Acidisphaera sp. S103]|uniref:chemotaxis protein CheA n=1 Tax=Acidisphaera sp. S103 TaxID=1747223 RepID=UPI001C20BA1A|nr:chemotaxis protein CheA [Acidisphaera sp. S103]